MDLQCGIVYGPVSSRRFGRSLGVNLAPAGRKTCNYNCAYCQYGWTEFPARGEFSRPADVINAVDAALARDPGVDAITLAGNGEPTLHPAFAPIVEGLSHVRRRRAPGAALERLHAEPPRRRLQPRAVRRAVHEARRGRRHDLSSDERGHDSA